MKTFYVVAWRNNEKDESIEFDSFVPAVCFFWNKRAEGFKVNQVSLHTKTVNKFGDVTNEQ